jgi:serine/threonine protein kinase
MSKPKIIDKKSERSIKYEKELLSKINHPYILIEYFNSLIIIIKYIIILYYIISIYSFIVNMNYAFQDNDNLYLVMDLLNGGDLRYHICKNKKFSEEQTSKYN